MTRQTVSEILREKLDYLRTQEAISSDAAQRFTLKKQIENAEAELVRLSAPAQAGFDREIEQRLADLEVRLEAAADPQLMAEVQRDIAGAAGDLSSVPTRTRYFLEVIVRDLYRRGRPGAGPKPLLDMIEDLCAEQGPLGSGIADDLGYIRRNGELIVDSQDVLVDITDRHRQAEVVVLMTINLAEWYLTYYLSGRVDPRVQVAADLPLPPNPYRGLLAFREEDAANYFGRETDAVDVLAALQRQPLVAVVGASGSGKSSLVQAGVLPHLHTAGDWVVASFRPRGRPLAELARALVGTLQDDPITRLAQADELAGLWSAGKVPLIDAVHEALRQTGKRRLLLNADQFEEVWTLGTDPDEAQRFLDLLAAAVTDAATPGGQPPALCLLLTLRADFLGHALGHQGLAAALDRYPKKLLGPVTDAERLRAIVCEPARRAGVQFEDLLVERILRDLAQLPGDETLVGGASLPLLEFTLEQLWESQRERRLTHLGYEELGGVQRALSRHADEVYEAFSEAERERVRHILVQMVRPGEGTADTRQVATRAQVRPENWPLVTCLADARLVVTGHDPVRDEDTAEPIHEALIQYWQPLRDWLRENRAFRLWQNGLRQSQAEWVRLDRDPDALLAGARLAEAEERLATQGERLGEDEAEYIQVSVKRRADERERQERLQRRLRIGLSLFLAVALALAGAVGWQWRLAQQEAERAEQWAARLSVNTANSLSAEGRLDQSILLLLDSLRVFDDTSIPEDILVALTRNIEKKTRVQTHVLFPNLEVFDTGDALLFVNNENNDIWRIQDSPEASLLVRGNLNDGRIEQIVSTPGGQYLVLWANGDIERVDSASGERQPIALPPLQEGLASDKTAMEFTSDGLIVRNSSDRSKTQVYDTANEHLFAFSAEDLRIVGRAPGNALYAYSNSDGILYKVQMGEVGAKRTRAKLSKVESFATLYGIGTCLAKMPVAARAAFSAKSFMEILEGDPVSTEFECKNIGGNTLLSGNFWNSAGGFQRAFLLRPNGDVIDIGKLFSPATGGLSLKDFSWVGYSPIRNRVAILLNRSTYVVSLDPWDEDEDSDPSDTGEAADSSAPSEAYDSAVVDNTAYQEPARLLLDYRHPSIVGNARFVGDGLVVVECDAGRLVVHDLDRKPKHLFSNSEAPIVGSDKPIETLHHGSCLGYHIPTTNSLYLASGSEIVFDDANVTEIGGNESDDVTKIFSMRVMSGGKVLATINVISEHACFQFLAGLEKTCRCLGFEFATDRFRSLPRNRQYQG
jgi:hypothetical protein